MTDVKRTEQPDNPAVTDLAERLRERGDKILAPSLWPSKHTRRVRWLRWRWWVSDPAAINTIADGYALTERWARHQAGVAAGRIWAERVEARRAEAEKRRAES